MASHSTHLNQWKHNRSFLPLIPSDYPDWLVTVVFYTALHVIDAVLAADKVTRIHSHETRNDVLQRTNRYSKIYKLYHPLYQLARTVRYLANPAEWIKYTDVDDKVIQAYLYPIEKSAETLLKADLELSPIVLESS